MREVSHTIVVCLIIQMAVALAASTQPVPYVQTWQSPIAVMQKHSDVLSMSNPIVISSNSEFAGYAMQGDGTAGNPYVIEGYSININDTGYGFCISIMNTDAYFTIHNCQLTGRSYAAVYDPSVLVIEGILLQLQNVKNGLVEDCTFKTFIMAVELIACESVEVSSCTVTGTIIPSSDPYPIGSGFLATQLSNRCIISANTIKNCDVGIGLHNNSTDFTIKGNDIQGCIESIYSCCGCLSNLITGNNCHNGDRGIDIFASNSTVITNNTCTSNRLVGISLDHESANNTVVFNTISNNGVGLDITTVTTTYVPPEIGVGLYVAGTGNNVTLNDFVTNGKNCRNEGQGNIYDYNYWSDYLGTDSDGNGIGDTPYAIQGDVPTSDPHPRMSRLSTTTAEPIFSPVFIGVAVTTVAILVVAGAVILKRR